MADKSGIEWTDATWNPLVGCSLVSPACTNCYAMAQAARIERMAAGAGKATHYEGTTKTVNGKPVWTGKLAQAPENILLQPLRWKRPRRIFVNSMSDLFHESIPDGWIDRAFAVMALAPQHTFQVLTKRPKRMREYVAALGKNAERDRRNELPAHWQIRLSEANPPGSLCITKADVYRALGVGAKMDGDPPTPAWPLRNVWLGVTAEDQPRADERIPDLLATPAAMRFVSVEPMLGPVDLSAVSAHGRAGWLSPLTGTHQLQPVHANHNGNRLDWVICGGESGPGARPMHPDWARSLRDQCAAAGVAFHFKQHGEWIGVPDLRNLPGGQGPGFGVFDHCEYDQEHEAVRVGKARAGRLLDGREHNDFPEPRA